MLPYQTMTTGQLSPAESTTLNQIKTQIDNTQRTVQFGFMGALVGYIVTDYDKPQQKRNWVGFRNAQWSQNAFLGAAAGVVAGQIWQLVDSTIWTQ